jgi:hypothetical protein
MINRIAKLTILLLFVQLTVSPAQVYEIEDVAAKNFKGVYELKDFGYAACFREDGQWLLEILDKSLVLKTKTVINFKIKDETIISGFSNGSTFLLIFSNSEKKHHLIGFEYTGRIIKQLELNEYIGDIFPAKHKGYYLPIRGKKKDNGRILFLSNKFNEAWNIEAPLGFPSQGLYESRYLTQAYEYPKTLWRGFTSATEDAIIWNYIEKKGTMSSKIIHNDVAAVSSDGKTLFRYEIDHSKDWVFLSTIQNGYAYLIGGTGNIEKNVIDQYWTRKLSMTGELIEERNLNKNIFDQDYDFPLTLSFIIKDLIDTGDGYLLIGAEVKKFSIWYFDKDFNFVNYVDVKRKDDKYLGIGGLASSLFYKNYQFVTSSKKGLYELIIYFFKKKKSISIEVAHTNDKDSHFIKEVENANKNASLKISWINIFPARPGEGILCFYQIKKKKITFIKVVFED